MTKKIKKVLIVKFVLQSNGKVQYSAMYKTIFGWRFFTTANLWWDHEIAALKYVSKRLEDYEVIHYGTTILN